MGSLPRLRSRALTAILAAAALGLAGCGDDEETTTAAAPENAAGAQGPGSEETVRQEPPPTPPEPPAEGDQGDAAPHDPEQAIQSALNDALASGDPALACEDAVTDAYVEQAYGSATGCRSAQGAEAVADAVELEEVEVEESRASGVVGFSGGVYDGEEGEVELVLEDESWKLDSLEVDVPPGP
jgi:hypothetical protein